MNPLRTSHINTYFGIGNIKFYKDGAVVLDVIRPWLESNDLGYSSSGIVNACAAINPEEIKTRRKLDLTREEHFVFEEGASYGMSKGKTLYVWLGAFEEVSEVSEVVSRDSETETMYINGLSLKSTWNDETEPRTIRINAGQCTRVEKKALGIKSEKLAEAINALMVHNRIYNSEAENLIKHWAELEKIVKG